MTLSPAPRPILSPIRTWAVCGLLVAICALVYAPVGHFGFLRYDDPENVSAEPHVAGGPTRDNLKWAFTTCLMGHWVPLTRVTYLLDQWWCGLDPGVMHVENVGLHAASAVLLFLFLGDATGRPARSAAVAGLFAVHPVLVESVAWITERRDVLSLPPLLGCCWAYVRYVRATSPGTRWAGYAASLALYAASLLCKATGMTAPVLLLLLDVWPLERLPRGVGRARWQRVLLDKLPFVALAVPVAAMAMHAQRAAGAATSLAAMPVVARVDNGLVSIVAYVRRLAVPTGLSTMYLPPQAGYSDREVAAAAGLVLVAIAVAILGRRRWPHVAFGVGWFLVALAPMSGVAQSGLQSMADRYMYVPSIGLAVAAVWTVADAAAAMLGVALAARSLPVITALVVAGLAVMCRVQVGYWRDERTLFGHAWAVTDDNWYALYQLALCDAADHDYPSAIDRFTRALQINPTRGEVWTDLGNCICLADPARSVPIYQQALSVGPPPDQAARAYANLGNAYLALHRRDDAIASFGRALQLDPSSGYARQGLAAARALNP